MVKSCIEQSGVKLNPHQILTTETILGQRGLLVVHSTGSGKTLTAVTAASCVLEEYPDSKVVVVTPKSLTDNFRKEMDTYGMSKKMMKRVKIMTTTEFARSHKKGSCKNTMLIVDEAHNLRTERGTQAKALIDCSKSAFKVLLLTATPVVNDPYDIANLMAMIYGKDPPSRAEFKGIIASQRQFIPFFKCKISYFRPTDLSNYPTVSTNEVKLIMDKAYYDAYMKTEERYLGIWRKEGEQREGGEAFFSALRQAVNQMSSPQLSKVDWIMAKVQEGERTLIYSEFVRSTLRPLMVLLEDDGIPYEHITGDMSREARTEAVNAYNSGVVNVLVVSSAGGEGLDLKGTKNVIITEPAWNESKIQQITGRAVRYNSHSHIVDPKDRLVNVYKLYITKPPPETKLEFGREKEDELLTKPAFTRHDYNLYVAGLKATLADSEERYADIDDPTEEEIKYYDATIAADKKAMKETYNQWHKRVITVANQHYESYMQYVPLIKSFCPNPTSDYLIDDLECYINAANMIIKANDDAIYKVRKTLEDDVREDAIYRLEGANQKKFQKKFMGWLDAYEKKLVGARSLSGGILYGSLSQDELSLFRRIKGEAEAGRDVNFVHYAVRACIIASRERTTEIAEKVVNRRDPKITAVVEAAKNFKDGLFRYLNFYVATEWQTAKGETKPIPPSIDTHIHYLSQDKQFLLNEFLSRIQPLTIENAKSCDDASWDYQFMTTTELRDDKVKERQDQKKLTPETWDWIKCDAPTTAGGYTMAQIRDFAKLAGLKDPPRKNTRFVYCAALKWKLLNEYGPGLAHLSWNDLMTVIGEVGLDPAVWEKEARRRSGIDRVHLEKHVRVTDLETVRNGMIDFPDSGQGDYLHKELTNRLEQKVNEKMDWSTWDWSRCGLPPKKGGYTPQMIKDYASTLGINLKSVTSDRFRAEDRKVLCGALKWLALKEVDAGVLKIVGEQGGIPRTDLLKMGQILGVDTSGIIMPLDIRGHDTMVARIHKALKKKK